MITEVLFTLTKTLIEKGFELPIYIFMVSQNGNVVSAKYEGGNIHVFVEHVEDPDWKLPISSRSQMIMARLYLSDPFCSK